MIKESESASSCTSTTSQHQLQLELQPQSSSQPQTQSPVSRSNRESPPPKPATVGTTRRRSSQSSTSHCGHSHHSPTSSPPLQQQQQQHTCGNMRRTSMPVKRNTPAFVHQDELWLTQRLCKPKCLLNDGIPPPDGNYDIRLYFVLFHFERSELMLLLKITFHFLEFRWKNE